SKSALPIVSRAPSTALKISLSRNFMDRRIIEYRDRGTNYSLLDIGMQRAAGGEVHIAAQDASQELAQVHERQEAEALLIGVREQVAGGGCCHVGARRRAVEI